MKEEKEAEEMEEKEKAKARMMHGQWMQRMLGLRGMGLTRPGGGGGWSRLQRLQVTDRAWEPMGDKRRW